MQGTIRNFLKDTLGAVAVFGLPLGLYLLGWL